MIGAFPSSLLDNVLLAFGSGAAAGAISLVVPRSWGWKAFPLVLIGSLAATEVVTVIYLGHRYDGYNMVVTIWHLLAGLAIIGSTYWLTLTARRIGHTGG